MRLTAPILSVTSNEIWQTLGLSSDKTVFEETWYQLPKHGLAEANIEAWKILIDLRSQAQKEIEKCRESGAVGSSLQAELEFHVPAIQYKALSALGSDLKFAMITSEATAVKVDDESRQKILVKPSSHAKCERCWHYRADVGADELHPQICGRCVRNLFGTGEYRTHA
jgi:isoleucyl-tRNA synthetase